MKIITISREFGSGGRELGKRLAEYLNYEYYDREIVTAISEKCGVNEKYAKYMLTHNFSSSVNINVRSSFHVPAVLQASKTELLRAQTNVIRDIAVRDKDCIIVGRNADILLKEYNPFRIFVCADTESKLKRCIERARPGENLSEKEILRMGKKVDKNRKITRELMSGSSWGGREDYNIIINTTGWDIKKLVPHIADIATGWYENFCCEKDV